MKVLERIEGAMRLETCSFSEGKSGLILLVIRTIYVAFSKNHTRNVFHKSIDYKLKIAAHL
jgi:hypothetical protein